MGTIRVLLVDDEMELVSTLAERLGIRGLDAQWMTSAVDALKRPDICSFDVAVLDVKIPKVSGIELKKRLQEKCPGMKFIFLTGHGSGADFAAGAAAAGGSFYLVKPVRIDTLIEKINAALEQQGTST